jgi:hypothetical protein
MIKDEKLDFWIEHGYNVLFVGKHGVGKTSIVKDAFERHNLNWKYFSASTMDPWVDMIGVPKEKTDAGGNNYLDLVRPKEFEDDTIEAIFFDEFNRSHKKIRNAVMELIQFGSINGKKFNNLRFIWAAINPSDDDDSAYDVEALDPAQEDRFHIRVNVPYKPHKPFFIEKFGEESASAAIEWWDGLSDEMKDMVSPRRLEYALDVASKGGELKYVLPSKTNISKLAGLLRTGAIEPILKKFIKEEDHQGAIEFIHSENNYELSIKHILKTKAMKDFYLSLLPPEKLTKLMVEKAVVADIVINEAVSRPEYAELLSNIFEAKGNNVLVSKIKSRARTDKLFAKAIFGDPDEDHDFYTSYGESSLGKKPVSCHHSRSPMSHEDYRELLGRAHKDMKDMSSSSNTLTRRGYVLNITNSMPEDMTLEEAEKTLAVLNEFAGRSHGHTLSGVPKIMNVLNRCIDVIHTESGLGWSAIKKKYKKYMSAILRKVVSDSKMSEKMLCPGKGSKNEFIAGLNKSINPSNNKIFGSKPKKIRATKIRATSY